MCLIFQWFKSNLDLVFFIYGLAFMGMGIAIWVQPKKKSAFKFANILWLLTGFALIHGANEFLDMWAIIKGVRPVFNIVRSFILIISFIFLFEFGRRLLRICKQKYIEKITKPFGWWLTFLIGLAVFILSFIPTTDTDILKAGSVWGRYLLCFPGGLLTSLGFVLYYKYEEKEPAFLKAKKYFFWVSLSFLVYGILSGLVVPRADFFPANWINADSFFSVTHIPVQAFRAVCAIIIAWAACGILRIFNYESVERLQKEISERKNTEHELKNTYIKLKESQGQLIQAEKLNALGRLASGVAHEVRNPLGVIIQGVNFLENKITAKEKDMFEILVMIKNNIKRADKIVDLLLDFSKARSLDLQPEDINLVLEDSLALVKNKFNNIEIIREIKTGMPRVLIDKNKIEQVFINVLLNAAQSMPEGGKIIIRSCDKQLEEVKNGIGKRKDDHFKTGERVVIVEFEDMGVGICEEHIEKIFDPFFTTKGPRGGVGLGLAVSRNILHMHKGLIYAESRVGKGTKITIILKIAER